MLRPRAVRAGAPGRLFSGRRCGQMQAFEGSQALVDLGDSDFDRAQTFVDADVIGATSRMSVRRSSMRTLVKHEPPVARLNVARMPAANPV